MALSKVFSGAQSALYRGLFCGVDDVAVFVLGASDSDKGAPTHACVACVRACALYVRRLSLSLSLPLRLHTLPLLRSVPPLSAVKHDLSAAAPISPFSPFADRPCVFSLPRLASLLSELSLLFFPSSSSRAPSFPSRAHRPALRPLLPPTPSLARFFSPPVSTFSRLSLAATLPHPPPHPFPAAGVNVLSRGLLSECKQILASLRASPPATLLVCSGKAASFCHGADVKMQLALPFDDPSALTAAVDEIKAAFGAIEALPCPTAAVLHGVALGGGLELALACDYRLAVADDAAGRRAKLTVGLPEVKLGIIAAAGGCVRLPRLLGLAQALPLLLSGKTLGVAQAKKAGLVHHVLNVDSAAPAAAAVHFTAGQAPAWAPALEALWAQGAALTKPARRFPRQLAGNTWIEQQLIFNAAKRQVDKMTGGRFPAFYVCLDTVIRAWNQPLAEAMQTETAGYVKLVRTPEAASLMSLFLARSDVKKRAWQPVQDSIGAEERPTATEAPLAVLVLGAGHMGTGLGQHLASRGAKVTFYDVSDKQLEAAKGRVGDLFQRLVRGRKMAEAEARRLADAVAYTSTLDAAAFEQQALQEGRRPIVLEAVFEDLALKRKLVAAVGREGGGGCRAAGEYSLQSGGILGFVQQCSLFCRVPPHPSALLTPQPFLSSFLCFEQGPGQHKGNHFRHKHILPAH